MNRGIWRQASSRYGSLGISSVHSRIIDIFGTVYLTGEDLDLSRLLP